MAKVIVNGTVTAAKNGSSYMTLWELCTSRNGKEFKRKWIVWIPELLNFADGSWVEIEGEFSAMPTKMKDELGNWSEYKTYEDRDGKQVTNWDLIINDPIILQSQLKEASTQPGIDQDDARKYGGTYGHLAASDQPF